MSSNYRKLIVNEHRDLSPYPDKEAVERYLDVQGLDNHVDHNREKFRPTGKISPKRYQKLMNAPTPWPPSSF